MFSQNMTELLSKDYMVCGVFFFCSSHSFVHVRDIYFFSRVHSFHMKVIEKKHTLRFVLASQQMSDWSHGQSATNFIAYRGFYWWFEQVLLCNKNSERQTGVIQNQQIKEHFARYKRLYWGMGDRDWRPFVYGGNFAWLYHMKNKNEKLNNRCVVG